MMVMMMMSLSENYITKIYSEGCKLQETREIKYIGSLITQNGKNNENIRIRINIAKSQFISPTHP